MGRSVLAGRDSGDTGGTVRAATPTDGKLRKHERHDDQCEADALDRHERAAAVGADFIGKLPDTAYANRGTHGRQDEASTACPRFR